MSDWRIHRREERCSRCSRVFGEGETIFSLLFLEPERLRREDACPDCFDRREAGAAGEVLFWRTRHTLDRKQRFAVDFDAIEELFVTLEGRREGRQGELRYLLSLLLLRKKRLKLVGVRRNAQGETLCLRRPRRQEEFEVQVFELDSERALSLKAELARVFEGAGIESLGRPEGVVPEGGSGVAEAPAPTPAS